MGFAFVLLQTLLVAFCYFSILLFCYCAIFALTIWFAFDCDFTAILLFCSWREFSRIDSSSTSQPHSSFTFLVAKVQRPFAHTSTSFPPFNSAIPTLHHVCLTFDLDHHHRFQHSVCTIFARASDSRATISTAANGARPRCALAQSRRVLINRQQNRGNVIILTKPFISHVTSTTFTSVNHTHIYTLSQATFGSRVEGDIFLPLWLFRST